MAEVLVPPQFYIANKNPEVLETLRKCFAWQMSDSILCVCGIGVPLFHHVSAKL